MHKKHKKYLKGFSFSLFFFILVYIVAVVMVLDEKTYTALESLDWYIYFVVILFSLTNYMVRFSRWMIFVRPMHRDISALNHFLIYISAFALTTTPAKSGEMIRSLYLSPLGISYGKSLGAFVSERVLDIIAVLLLSYMVIMFSFSEYTSWLFAGGVFLATLFYLLRSRLLSKISYKVLKGKSKKVVLNFTSTMNKNFSSLMLFKAMPLSVLAWSVQSLSLVVVVYALGFEANIFLLMGIYAMSILAGAISFIPGGIGATEGAMSLLLISLGMDASLAVMASIIVRGITLWLAVCLGLVCMVSLNFVL